MTNIGIINHRLNYLALGSIIAVTKKYVDKVYVVIDNEDANISELALLMGAEVIEASKNRHFLNKIVQSKNENNLKIVVALYGDGTHDPNNIAQLIDPVIKGEFDLTIDSSSVDSDSCIKNNAFYFSRGKAHNGTSRNDHIGFAACSIKCLESVKSPKNGFNIAEEMLINAKNNSINIKYINFNGDTNFSLLNLYKIGVVVPAYNEEVLIQETIDGIPKYVNKIYIIDDGSKDKTSEIINQMKDPRIVYIRHEINKGVGSAIVTGYKQGLKDDMEILAVMAGDNQMDPEHLPRLLMPIIDCKADYTKGNRLISKDFRIGMSTWRYSGNAILTFITKIGCGYWHIMDPQNGYTAISRHALEIIDLDSIYPYYGYCNDMLIKLNTFEQRVKDVVIPARYGREKSKIKYSSYIRKVAPMIFRGFLWRLKTKYIILDFHPLVFFYVASMILIPVGVGFGAWILLAKLYRLPVSQNYPLLTVFITLMGVQLLLFAMLFDMQADRSRNEQI